MTCQSSNVRRYFVRCSRVKTEKAVDDRCWGELYVPLWLPIVTCLVLVVSLMGTAYSQDDQRDEAPVDPVAIVLIEMDLRDAVGIMTRYDRDEDGIIDRNEQKRLSWDDEKSKKFDLNRDGKFSHLEIALWVAKRRIDAGVLQIDGTLADKHLRRYDSNKNGQLDPAEIAAHNWPPDPEEYDQNTDGIITRRELITQNAFQRGLRKELGIIGVDQGGAIKAMNRFDENSDHRLSPDEFANAKLPGTPDQFDHDGDGLLSLMEVATALAKHRMDLGLTPADQAKAREILGIYDQDRDGVISADELESANAANNPMLAMIDANRDGDISSIEIEKYLSKMRKQKGYDDSHLAAARRLLARHDRDRNGSISEDELGETAGQGELSKSLLKTIDLNRDSTIDLDELAKHVFKTDNETNSNQTNR